MVAKSQGQGQLKGRGKARRRALRTRSPTASPTAEEAPQHGRLELLHAVPARRVHRQVAHAAPHQQTVAHLIRAGRASFSLERVRTARVPGASVAFANRAKVNRAARARRRWLAGQSSEGENVLTRIRKRYECGTIYILVKTG